MAIVLSLDQQPFLQLVSFEVLSSFDLEHDREQINHGDQCLIRYVNCCAVVHNLCIDDPVPSSWIEPEDNADGEGEDSNVLDWNTGEVRRTRLLHYILDLNGI